VGGIDRAHLGDTPQAVNFTHLCRDESAAYCSAACASAFLITFRAKIALVPSLYTDRDTTYDLVAIAAFKIRSGHGSTCLSIIAQLSGGVPAAPHAIHRISHRRWHATSVWPCTAWSPKSWSLTPAALKGMLRPLLFVLFMALLLVNLYAAGQNADRKRLDD
jgi:hypothetical protein